MLLRKFALLLFSFCLLFQAQTLYACADMADQGPMHECCCPESMAPPQDDCCCEIDLEIQVTSADLGNDTATDITLPSGFSFKAPPGLFTAEIPFHSALQPVELTEHPSPGYSPSRTAKINSRLYLTTARLRL